MTAPMRVLPRLEPLEDRVTPSTFHVTPLPSNDHATPTVLLAGTVLPSTPKVQGQSAVLSLNNTNASEAEPVGTKIAKISDIDSDHDQNDTFTYSLVSGSGSTFNKFFKIHNDQLLIARPLHDLPSNSLSIRIRATDHDGTFVEAVFQIHVASRGQGPNSAVIRPGAGAQGGVVNGNLAGHVPQGDNLTDSNTTLSSNYVTALDAFLAGWTTAHPSLG
jgi:hypothetical protein